MTEFNYLIYCPACKTETNFLGGTSEAICMDCEGTIQNPMIHERLTLDALKRTKLEQRNAESVPFSRVVHDAETVDPLVFDNNARVARDNKVEEILSMLFGLKAEYDKNYRFAKEMYTTRKDRWTGSQQAEMGKFWKQEYLDALEREDAIDASIETIMGIEQFKLGKVCGLYPSLHLLEEDK